MPPQNNDDEPGRQARAVEQVQTHQISTAAIMRRAAFGQGVADVRTGQAPRFDDFPRDQWSYDRGRLFACIAPMTMPIRNRDGKLNLKAVQLCEAAIERKLIP
jgi:hypothetical protein